MKRTSPLLVPALLAAPLALLLAPLPCAAETLGVDDVLRLALVSHPRLEAARAEAGAAEALSKSARGKLLPTLSVHDEAQVWDSPFEIGFGAGPPVRARDQTTNTFTAAVSQPLLDLLSGVQEHAARASQAAARRAQSEAAEAELREELQTQYLHLFEARALQQVAQSSQAELGRQVESTMANVKAGTLTNADLLRVQVALANARQQEVAAVTAQTVARVSLLSAIGRSPEDNTVEFAEPTQLLEQSRQRAPLADAAERRPEVRAAELATEAAHHEQRSQLYALLPHVDLRAAYSRVDGQVFAPKNSAFVGVTADWPIWQWGASGYAHSAAEQSEVAARARAADARRQARADVSIRRAQLAAAESAVQLARETLGSAAEAYRVMEAVVKVGSGTTTDLLDAQATLTAARLNVTHSEYEQAIAHLQLRRALGEAPTTAR